MNACNYFLVWLAVYLVLSEEISQSWADNGKTCNTNADCTGNWQVQASDIYRTKRTCGLIKCKDKYCETDSECSDPTLCCHSNKCTDHHCKRCTEKWDCLTDQVCCGSGVNSFNQGFCSDSCVGESCSNNDDCVRYLNFIDKK